MITKTEARLIRLSLAAQLDEENEIEIAEKFIDSIFDDTEHLERWARGYGVRYERITYPDMHRTRKNWIKFYKP